MKRVVCPAPPPKFLPWFVGVGRGPGSLRTSASSYTQSYWYSRTTHALCAYCVRTVSAECIVDGWVSAAGWRGVTGAGGAIHTGACVFTSSQCQRNATGTAYTRCVYAYRYYDILIF